MLLKVSSNFHIAATVGIEIRKKVSGQMLRATQDIRHNLFTSDKRVPSPLTSVGIYVDKIWINKFKKYNNQILVHSSTLVNS